MNRHHLQILLIFLLRSAGNVTGQASCPKVKRMYNATKPDGQNVRLDTRGPIDRYGELSGIAFSPTQKAPSGDPVVYSFSDGGSGERIGMWDPQTGERLRTLRISNATTINWDWEAMTVGTCGNTPGKTCLYLADTGDNTARVSGGRRTSRQGNPYRVLKIVEPMLEDFQDTDYIPDSYISILNIDYNHTSSPTKYADVEAIFLDHKGWGGGSVGDIYLVTKWDMRRLLTKSSVLLTRLFKIPPSVWPKSYGGSVGHYSPQVVGNDANYQYEGKTEITGRYTEVTSGQLMGMTWRGGEMSFDGTLIGLATTWNSTLFLRCPGQSVLDALALPDAKTKYCRLWDSPTQKRPGGSQVESFAFTPEGDRSLIIPEGHRPRLGWTEFDYNTNMKCPDLKPTLKPTGIPTYSPTTQGPSSRPTDAPSFSPTGTQRPTDSKSSTDEPTQKPSSSPLTKISATPASTPGIALAVVEDSIENAKLELCQGDCSSDNDCGGNLKCFKRSKGMSRVPGCQGDANSFGGKDFCILSSMMEVELEVIAETNDVAIDLCQGDCEYDDECAGKLVCYQSPEGTNNIPGCAGNPQEIGDGNEGFCIRTSSKNAAISAAQTNSLSVAEDDYDVVASILVAACSLILLGLGFWLYRKVRKFRATEKKTGGLSLERTFSDDSNEKVQGAKGVEPKEQARYDKVEAAVKVPFDEVAL